MSIDIGLLLLRVITGVLLAGHGMQKISYRFGGHGLRGGIEEFRSDGFRGGAITALAAGLGQLGSGLFLAAGLATPAAAMAAIGVMTVAATVKARNGLWVQHDGYEFPLVLITIASALAFTGAGAYSVDALLGLDHLVPWFGLGAVTLGVGAGLTARLVLHTPNPSRTES
ncbi:DoxX family protein [Promicromonospora sp. NPDC090134]|uniref:DoxX family protein n=1 Tax=Promicromonospora sp. NPDC090134 TaxID=3364408 RepID=UPI0037FE0699